MYSCNKCDRAYRTQNSLTRHAHSHRSDNKHQCVTCGVVFYRKDLLSRHSKLHGNPFHFSSSRSNDIVDARLRRQRCHTACDRCREIWTKCNGRIPCHTCSEANLTCDYSHRSARLSRLPRDTATRTSSDQQAQPDVDESIHHRLSPSIVEEADRDSHIIESGQPMQPSPDLQQNYHLDMDDCLPENPLPSGNSTYLDIYNDPIGNTLTWPWLHEDLFLSANSDVFTVPTERTPLLDFRGVGHVTPGIDQSGITPSFSTGGHGAQFQSHANTNLYPATRTVMAGHNTQINDSLPGGLEDEAAIPSLSSARGISSVEATSTSFAPAATAATSQLEQSHVIHNLVAFALAPNSGNLPNSERVSFWQDASVKVVRAFRLPYGEESSPAPALYHFCDQYLEHFAPLWPLLSRHSLDYGALHPALFLVLTSIGSMYCGSHASGYGAMMHSQIRGFLTMAIELEDEEHDFVWLAQARLLTQVAALYFGQPKAFTYAHHLGALLVAQARRHNLFSAVHASKTLQKFHLLKGVASDDERFGLWLQLETRRRLAYGIFRGDTYTSALLHTKPLISMEELDLWLPTCDAVWRSKDLSVSLCLQMIEHDQTPSGDLWASDLFRIAMESKEPLPPLSPAGQELLMFGLQYPIWRFSKDREVLARLTCDPGEAVSHDSSFAAADVIFNPSIGTASNPTRNTRRVFNKSVDSEAHHLESTVRQMEDLQQERERLLSALVKWERNLPLVKTFVRTNLERSSLMSSLILFHLGYIRLLVPLEELHQIQYRLADGKEIENSLISTVHNWARSPQGELAAERACNIYNIIAKESDKETSQRVRFNLLAFIGLHHSAVLLWAYAAVQGSTSTSGPLLTLKSSTPISVDKSHSTRMLSSFATLCDTISPAQWSSFAKATSMLSNQQFPQGTDD